MNTELYIARKILPRRNSEAISNPIVNIAMIAIALGLAVMIIAVSVIVGFKSTISEQTILTRFVNFSTTELIFLLSIISQRIGLTSKTSAFAS